MNPAAHSGVKGLLVFGIVLLTIPVLRQFYPPPDNCGLTGFYLHLVYSTLPDKCFGGDWVGWGAEDCGTYIKEMGSILEPHVQAAPCAGRPRTFKPNMQLTVGVKEEHLLAMRTPPIFYAMVLIPVLVCAIYLMAIPFSRFSYEQMFLIFGVSMLPTGYMLVPNFNYSILQFLISHLMLVLPIVYAMALLVRQLPPPIYPKTQDGFGIL